ncbi:hypothetical protein E8E13_002553 [Curvularia kusanoi]|uniref:Uncharacterized protein n=1 Tax=Curvularia kusanoi TaxID=90978 RepID=A0A9P4WDP1_CURKU|nr:hypothetical protein E8E13_002553 [Curvularia kusanoi]
MDPSVAFRVERPTLADLQTSNPLTFPNELPDALHIDIPSPHIRFPEWTTSPYEDLMDDSIPNTLRFWVRLPEPAQAPAHYAAAVDTMQITNEYFWHLNQGLRDLITDAAIEQRMVAWEVDMTPRGRYPTPPDPRTLFVKSNGEFPTDDYDRPLWADACDTVANMGDDDWERYLIYTREDFEDAFGGDMESLMLNLFIRYLVWHEYVGQTSDRWQRYNERQPTFDELSAFFDRDYVRDNGATLAEIHHLFPHAHSMRMLVHRIRRFARIREPEGPFPVAVTGRLQPAERRYHRLPDPTREDVLDVMERLWAENDSITEYMVVAEQFFPSAENMEIIEAALEEVGARDVTTHRWIPMLTDGPNDVEIMEVVDENDAYLTNGFTLEELAAHFPDRVWDLRNLRGFLDGLDGLYFDEEENRHFPLFPRGNGEYESEEDSIRMRYITRLATLDPEAIEEEYVWDHRSRRLEERLAPAYEPRAVPEGSPTEVATSHGGSPPPARSPQNSRAIDLGSPIDSDSSTEVATSYGGSPPRGPSPPGPPPPNAVHVPVAVIEVVPIEPAALPGDDAAAPGDAPVAPVAPPAPAAGSSGRGRPAKRRAEDAAEPAGPAKKGRKNPKIRCSGRTQKGMVCKRQKDREDGEDTWYCNVHRRD